MQQKKTKRQPGKLEKDLKICNNKKYICLHLTGDLCAKKDITGYYNDDDGDLCVKRISLKLIFALELLGVSLGHCHLEMIIWVIVTLKWWHINF